MTRLAPRSCATTTPSATSSRWKMAARTGRSTTADSNDRPIIHTGLRKQSLLFAHAGNKPNCDTLKPACMHGSTDKKKMFIDLATGDGADMSHFIARLAAKP